MSNKKTSLFKKIAVPGAVIGSAWLAAGTAFVEMNLSRNGIKAVASSGGVVSDEDCRCFYESDEALAGQKFHKERAYDNISMINRSGTRLHAMYYQAEKPSHVYAFSCHGYTGEPYQNACYAKRFFDMGFNVILPHLRGHGESEHKYCTMGWLDRLDIVDWVNAVVEKDPEAKIILHGVSMGAATVMMATGEALPDNVKCCIEDCGFTSLCDQFSVQIREKSHIPANVILNIAEPAARLILGFSLKDASALEQVRHSKTPTLFIHGDKDSTVPFWMNYPLFNNASCEKERLVVPGATHAASGYAFPEIYWNAITEFIGKYL